MFKPDEADLVDALTGQLHYLTDGDVGLAWMIGDWKGDRVLIGGEFVSDDEYSPMIIAVTPKIAEELKPPPNIIENET